VVQNIVKPTDLKPPNWIFLNFENQGISKWDIFEKKKKRRTKAIFTMRKFFLNRRRAKVILKTCPKNRNRQFSQKK
jgi:hypothetical protein